MTPLYEERQFSWYVITLVPLVLAITLIMDWNDPKEAIPLWFYPLMIGALSFFSSMRVTVTRDHVRVTLTWGYPCKTIAIEDIQSFDTYEKTGVSAWLGTKIKPARGQYTLQGRRGLVIIPLKGMPITISSNEPKKFHRAIEKATERKLKKAGS